ncbi:MAG TPA: ribose 5-phosphate isomerase B, partial [Verrucomicrobiales bacterium]|nr:ribose 5-phosphate isomerase B [Verrucomicrobiales bacterium]
MSNPLPHSLAIGSDHGGLALKNAVVAHLKAGGHAVEDLGAHDGASVDYPDFAELVSARVLDGRADAGILVCTTGIGMSIAANRHAGIQASLVHDAATAAITREHNASNILCLAGKTTPETTAKEIVDTWLKTPFAGGRHGRRVDKMNTQAHPLSILATSDPAVAEIIRGEQQRQQDHIE